MLLGLTACHKPPKPRTMPTPRVYVKKTKEATVPKRIPAIGHFTSVNSAEIKAQVEGRLLAIHYKQGQDVREGDLLLTIDPRPYEAALAKSDAQLLENLANLKFAKDRVNRYETLVTQNYVSQLDYDQYVSNMEMYEAQVKKDEASIMEAQINLDYCYIKAPFDGRIGKQLIDIGNLITNDGSTLLTIKQLDPIWVDFTVSERDLHLVQEYQREKDLTIEIEMPDQGGKKATGKLIVVNNEVDEAIGMVKLRAQLDNPKKTMWPGQFVRVNVVLTEMPHTVLVPLEAISIGQKGRYVYKLGDGNTAIYQGVELGETYGDWIEVKKGLHPNETVITKGQLNVRPNMKVQVVEKKQ